MLKKHGSRGRVSGAPGCASYPPLSSFTGRPWRTSRPPSVLTRLSREPTRRAGEVRREEAPYNSVLAASGRPPCPSNELAGGPPLLLAEVDADPTADARTEVHSSRSPRRSGRWPRRSPSSKTTIERQQCDIRAHAIEKRSCPALAVWRDRSQRIIRLASLRQDEPAPILACPLPPGPPTPGPAGGELGDRSAPDSRLLILRAAPEYPPRRAASPRHQTGARTTPSSSLHAPPGSPRTPARTTFNNSFPAPQYSLAGRPWRRPASPSARLRPVAAVPQHPQLGQNAAHGPEGSADTTIPAAPPATIARDNVGCAELQRATMMSDIRPAVGPSMPLLSRKPNTSKAQGISPKTRRGHRIMRGPTRSRA